jgi:four helix bundle protein
MPVRMSEWVDQLEARTQRFAVAVARLSGAIAHRPECRDAAWQLLKASGSVAANHRAMRRARSAKEFKAKLQIVDEEADESVCWLEIVSRLSSGRDDEVSTLLDEARQLRAIFAKAKKTARRRQPP